MKACYCIPALQVNANGLREINGEDAIMLLLAAEMKYLNLV